MSSGPTLFVGRPLSLCLRLWLVLGRSGVDGVGCCSGVAKWGVLVDRGEKEKACEEGVRGDEPPIRGEVDT